MANKKRIKSNTLPQDHPRLREAGLLIILALSAYFAIALFTYHAQDSTVLRSHFIANSGGKVGAWVAMALLKSFGFLAYLLPILLSYGAWQYFRLQKNLWQGNQTLAILRLTGLFLVLFSSTALLCLAPPFTQHLPYFPGGWVGYGIALGFSQLLGFTGASLCLFALFTVGITLATGLSWLSLLEKLGRLTRRLGMWLMIGLHAFATGTLNFWRAQRARRRERQEQIFIAAEKSAHSASDENVISLAGNAKANSAKKSRIEPQLAPSENFVSRERAITSTRIEPRLTTTELNLANDRPDPALGISSQFSPPPSFMPEQDENSALKTVNKTISKPAAPAPAPFVRRPAATSSEGATSTLPSIDLLDMPTFGQRKGYTHAQLELLSRNVEARLKDFGIEVQVVAVHPGPVITRFEMQLAAGIKVSRITTLAKDLARSLSVISVRVVEVIPGKAVVGLEVPNEEREMVRLSEVIASEQYEQAHSALAIALGKDIAGYPVVVDLVKMPHLLVAGTTGSGKSVSINTMLLSLLYKARADQVRMILIDPKMLELSVYEGIPHLLTPVVTDMRLAANALRWCVGEMDRRYRLMAALGVRNLAGYNQKVNDAIQAGKPIPDPLWQAHATGEPDALQPMPFIVVIVDEFADMMMVVGKKVEQLIARLAQKARAAGIHMILATQRPSVDVITGLIKANIPTRVAFQVSSRVDSRTILDQQGAEQLLGHGDMLYLPPGSGVPIRIHGAFVADHEVHKVVSDLKQQGAPQYLDEILDTPFEMNLFAEEGGEGGNASGESDPLYDQAVQIIIETRRASISSVQRRLKIGYNRAARLMEDMEKAGIVGPMESNGNREILIPERA